MVRELVLLDFEFRKYVVSGWEIYVYFLRMYENWAGKENIELYQQKQQYQSNTIKSAELSFMIILFQWRRRTWWKFCGPVILNVF